MSRTTSQPVVTAAIVACQWSLPVSDCYPRGTPPARSLPGVWTDLARETDRQVRVRWQVAHNESAGGDCRRFSLASERLLPAWYAACQKLTGCLD